MAWDELIIGLSPFSKDDIIGKAYKLGLKRSNYYWSLDDVQILKNGYLSKTPVKEIYKMLNGRHTMQSIATKAKKLGVSMRNKWTESEIQTLKDNYSKLPMYEIFKLIPRHSKACIMTMSTTLNLTSYNRMKIQWNEDMDNFLINNWKTMSDFDLGVALNRKQLAIKSRRHRLKLFREIPAGQYTYLYEFLRKNIVQWKKDSVKNCNYKCIVTHQKFDDIHHLHGVNLIINETVNNLGFVNKRYQDYSKSEKNKLLKEFLSIHSKYPLGVCLTHDVHMQFHKLYGYGNNTEDQFNSFLLTYYPHIKLNNI